MRRREFMKFGAATIAASTYAWCADNRHGTAATAISKPMDAAAFHAARRYADISFGKIAYIERSSGDPVLFLHGAPLNSFQWRGAIDRLSAYRRCVAPDFMGLGYSQISEHQSLSPGAQAAMLAALLDTLAIPKVDIIASDSGGGVAQLFLGSLSQACPDTAPDELRCRNRQSSA